MEATAHLKWDVGKHTIYHCHRVTITKMSWLGKCHNSLYQLESNTFILELTCSDTFLPKLASKTLNCFKERQRKTDTIPPHTPTKTVTTPEGNNNNDVQFLFVALKTRCLFPPQNKALALAHKGIACECGIYITSPLCPHYFFAEMSIPTNFIHGLIHQIYCCAGFN